MTMDDDDKMAAAQTSHNGRTHLECLTPGNLQQDALSGCRQQRVDLPHRTHVVLIYRWQQPLTVSHKLPRPFSADVPLRS